MKNILFVVDNLGRGGAQSITCALVNFLSHLSYVNVTVCVLNNKDQQVRLDPEIELIDLKLHNDFACGKLWKNKILRDYEEKLVDNKINNRIFDLIVLGFHNGYYLYDYLQQKEKVWFWMHGEILERRLSKNLIGYLKNYFRYERHKKYFKILLNGKNIITVSHHLEENYRPILQNSDFITIPNGIVLPKMLNGKNNILKKWDVLFVGRLVNLKQVDHAVKAFHKANLPGKFGILGDGPEISSLKKLVNRLNLQERVDFLGWSDTPQEFIQQSRCVILCSSTEGSPVSLLQALSLNVPVVSYNSSSSIELLFSNRVMKPYLVPKQDIEKLSIALKQCVHNPYDTPQEILVSMDIRTMADSFLRLIEK